MAFVLSDRPRLTSANVCSKARLGMFIRPRNDAVKSFLASVANLGCDLRIGCIEKPSCTAALLHERTGGPLGTSRVRSD